MFDDSPSDGGPRKKLFLPSLPAPWKSRWYRKNGRIYVDAWRGNLNGKPVRFCRLLENIVSVVEAKEREILRHGELANALSTGQRWEAAESFLICERLGVRLLDVVREFEGTHPHGPNARTLDQVRLAVVEAKRKQGRSELHIRSIDYRLRVLIETIGDKPVTAITTRELQAVVNSHAGNWNANTMASVTQGWKIALNYAIRQGWLVKNPANLLDLPRIIHKEPEILTIDQARRLLAATLFRDRNPLLPDCRAFLAIGMFAGLRPSEIAALEWRHVSLETATIRVTAGSAKDRDRRIVTVLPNLIAWLRPIARPRGQVVRHRIDEIHAALRPVLKVKEWPQDVLRHSFASYHFSEFENEARTKKEMGHRDDSRILYNHYLVPVAGYIARQFWTIFPPYDVLPCYAPGWAEANPPVRLAVDTPARLLA